MRWSYHRSIILTKLCILVFVAGYFAVILGCPRMMDLFVRTSFSAAGKSRWLFITTVYACALPIGLLLLSLWKLIGDIGLEEIFTGANIRRLRIISWMCFLVGAVCLASMAYYVFWGIIGACMSFMGLLIRVIKNAFEWAKELKEEVDYTI
ncbi:MAG: DUF2975 domain-containing protein [Lachnospiraceae bacterium]|nr:DUF2975 domain-containing protein [Lachnospiraceae bacterium]